MTDELLAAIRSGINTRHRLCEAFPRRHPDDIACAVASLVYRGHVRKHGRRLEVV